MKHTTTLFAVLALSLFSITQSGCKKDDKDDPKTGSSALSGDNEKSWSMVSVSQDGTDITGTFLACQLDNKIVFKKSNNYFEMNEGNIKCTSSDPQIINSGKWELKESNTKLEIYRQSDTVHYTVLELTDTKLKLESSLGGSMGSTLVETFKNP